MEDTKNIYRAGNQEFGSFMTAVAFAKENGLIVTQIDNGLQRWMPAKPTKKSTVRHFIVNADGTETEFSRVKQ